VDEACGQTYRYTAPIMRSLYEFCANSASTEKQNKYIKTFKEINCTEEYLLTLFSKKIYISNFP
jgi:hypothetical protein